MSDVLERFLRYVRIDTQAQEGTGLVPSTLKQLDLCRLLADECRVLGLRDVVLSPQGTVLATVPATVPHRAPAFALVAHVDTEPGTSGKDVQPQVHRNYLGGDLPLPRGGLVLKVEDNPELLGLVGGTIITTDGTTLLGADDKAGVAAIMAMAAHLMQHPEIPHGPVKLCFTCDEEIGHGVDHLDIPALGVVCAYTLDGDGRGKIDCETFSADQAIITVTGVGIHPSIGKGKLVNAIRILSRIIAGLPQDRLSPETTDGRDGFVHPYMIEGGTASATARFILRDFETARLAEYAALLESLAEPLRSEYPTCQIEIQIVKQYRNMRDGLPQEPRALKKAVDAFRAIGIEPEQTIIRGGTDGSRLTEMGLPTPNLSTGEHNPHSPLEWTSEEELETAVAMLVELARAWGREVISG